MSNSNIKDFSIHKLLGSDFETINEAINILEIQKEKLELQLFDILTSKDMVEINKHFKSIENAIAYRQELPNSIRVKLRDQTYTIEDFEYIKLMRELFFHTEFQMLYLKMEYMFINSSILSDDKNFYQLVKDNYNKELKSNVKSHLDGFFQDIPNKYITNLLEDEDLDIKITHTLVEKMVRNPVNENHNFFEYLITNPKYKKLFSDRTINNNYVKNALFASEGKAIKIISENLTNVELNLNKYSTSDIKKTLIKAEPENLDLIFSHMKFNAVFLTEFMDYLASMPLNDDKKINTWNVFKKHLIAQDDYNIEQCLNYKLKNITIDNGFSGFMDNIRVFHNLNKETSEKQKTKGLKL